MIKDKADSDQKTMDLLVALIKKQKPDNMKQLIENSKSLRKIPEDKLMDLLLELEAEKKIKIIAHPFSENKIDLFFSRDTLWYWLVLSLCTVTLGFLLVVPETLGPLLYVRYFVGLLFVLYLPGYSLKKTLFPESLLFNTSQYSLDLIEGVVVSFGLSLTLTAVASFILTFTPWGLCFMSLGITLFALTMTISTYQFLKVYREKERLTSRKARKNQAYFVA